MDGQHSEFFLSGLQKLEQRAKKCIELRGEYVEKIPTLVAAACLLPGEAELSAPPRISCNVAFPLQQCLLPRYTLLLVLVNPTPA